MSNRFDLTAEWNQNIIRNLHNKFPETKQVDPRTLLERYDEWGMMGCNDETDGIVEFLVTGE